MCAISCGKDFVFSSAWVVIGEGKILLAFWAGAYVMEICWMMMEGPAQVFFFPISGTHRFLSIVRGDSLSVPL